jgi:hypothetical protein
MYHEASWYKLYQLNEGALMPFVAFIGAGSLIAVSTRIDFPECRQFVGTCAPKLLGIAVNTDGSANEEHRDEQRTVPGNVSGGRKVRGEKGRLPIRLPIGRSLPSCLNV